MVIIGRLFSCFKLTNSRKMASSPEFVAISSGGKKQPIEKIYQKKTALEHILLRPDTYIGSVEKVTQPMWVWDEEESNFVNRVITFVPGLYKIFDEIIVNAADNKQRSPSMNCIKIKIDPVKNVISVHNNGDGIRVALHAKEKMYVPTMTFGELYSSSNFDDDEKKVTGGRNGYGAKLCNIFSLKFSVETSNKEDGKHFFQEWQDNMKVAKEPVIKASKGEDFTRVTFTPDLAKFKMDKLDKDIVDLMSRRAYDLAGSTKNVKVYLNDKLVQVQGFKAYVERILKDRTDEQGNPLKVVHESCPNGRWEVAVTCSDKGLQQISFVNSIATTKGGRHVDHVVDQVTEKVLEVVRKKTKKEGVTVKPFQVKNHIWVFVNCLIINPTFDSQTKENMTLQERSFGSKCTLTDKFMHAVQKSGIVDSVLTWVQFKSQTQLNKKCSARTMAKIKGIPKLDDANDAGGKNGLACTLILTEGDSAKTLAVAGLGVIGRDRYGVFPLRGKLLNVREASTKQIMDNVEINALIKIVGLQYKKKYETKEDMIGLRYGKIMIMTDQDQDGSHIKGLLINFIHHNWPGLIKLPFLEEFITPIVKVSRDKDIKSFYSLPEFEEWKKATNNWHSYKIKYYKGLGTSTSKEAKEYFSDMDRHRIKFKYSGVEDDSSIQLAFSKKMADQRKEWLTNGMETRKQRREAGLSEIYLYGKTTTTVSYQEFVNQELILFSNMDNERSIPSLVDGFKPGQRKVMFTCFKRSKKEIKVAQLAGSVAELSAYHHGEVSLMGTIVNLAQNFVGSNNINLLMPIGQFGTRIQGGKDSASARYIFTKLSPLARHIFNTDDDFLLKYLNEDNQKIEPEWYIPIIPMVLVNGAEGIGTGWMTKIPNYNVRDIVANLKRLINGDEPVAMIPSFKNFRGTIDQIDPQRFVSSGVVSVLNNTTFEITELPIRVWTQPYKENVLEAMLYNEKQNSLISNYKEYHTDTTVRFVVTMTEDKFAKAENEGLHKVFKLSSSMSTSSMVLFDHNGVLRKYDDVLEILREFYALRMEYYVRRKNFKIGHLKAELLKLSNQVRFILEKISGEFVTDNKRKAVVLGELISRKYDPDPIKKWKANALPDDEPESGEDQDTQTEDSDSESKVKKTTDIDAATDFDYLMTMPVWNFTLEKKEKLIKEKQSKQQELEVLSKRSPSDLWIEDLDNFSAALNTVEEKERQSELQGQKKSKLPAAGRGKKAVTASDLLPSAHGRVVVPVIDREIKVKKEKATGDGVKKGPGRKKKNDSVSADTQEDDVDAKGDQKKAVKRKMKQTTLSFDKAKPKRSPKKKAGKNDSESEEEDEEEEFDISDSDDDFMAKPKKTARPTAEEQSSLFDSLIGSDSSAKKENGKARISSDSDMLDINDLESENSKGKLGPKSTGAAKTIKRVTKKTIVISNDEESNDDYNDVIKPLSERIGQNKTPEKPSYDFDMSDNSDDDFMNGIAKKSAKSAAPAKKANPPKKRAPKKAADESSPEEDKPPKKKRTVAPKKPQKKFALSSDEEEEDATAEPRKKMVEDNGDAPRSRSARSRAPVSYNFFESEDSD